MPPNTMPSNHRHLKICAEFMKEMWMNECQDIVFSFFVIYIYSVYEIDLIGFPFK